MDNKLSPLILCSDRLPTESGEYEVLNNSGCNSGRGRVPFVVGEGWKIEEIIRSFYVVIGWFENDNPDASSA